ncbi:MAG: ABC transporter ATP-binding protein [Clostridia bacterium]|nr:ABC transporter ATP-binding protein [Clostridia bacterium]
MDELLRAERLVKEFPVKKGVVHAVSDVSFSIRKGETLGLVGESGCGKSTLGKLLIDLITPTSGAVWFRGEDLSQVKGQALRTLRRGMQMIFQDPYASLDPRMRVGDIIMEPMNAHRVGKDRAERVALVRELMDQVGIRPELFNRYPHQFSGGQRQRIGIARALALNPELIICDEPVSALDVSIQAQILNLLGDLQQQRSLTYLFISHDLNVVRYLSDRVAVMFLGRLCELSPTEQLYTQPRHPYTRFLLDAVLQPDPTLRDAERALLVGEVSSPVNPPSGCRFHPRCPFADARCRQEQPDLVEMAPGHLCACHHPLEDREIL